MVKGVRPITAVADAVWITALTALAGFVVTDEMFARSATFWDNAFFYSIFWNQLDSLNRFGEPAWWFPANQFGWPAFYYSILGDVPVSTPVFVLFGLLSFVLGRLGIQPDYFTLYTAYYGFVVPGLVNAAVFLVLRHFVRSRPAVWLGVAISAFSPGTLVNMSDIGFLEPLAYSLFFVWCWLRFLDRPGASRFWLLAAATAMVAFGVNFPFMMWNFYFVPSAVVLSVFGVPGGWRRLRTAIESVPVSRWALATVSVVLCAIPSFLTFTHGGAFIRNSIKTGVYDYKDLKSGNPFELLAVSMPSIGFEWDAQNRWAMLAAGGDKWAAYHYMGILCLPLALLALLYGRPWLRRNLAILLVISGAFISLSAHNYLLSFVIRSSRALQANNHWSDLGFRAGAYLLLLFLAAVGFDLICKGHRRALRAFPAVLVLSAAFTTVVYSAHFGPEVFKSNVFGALSVLTLLAIVASLWLRPYVPRRARAMGVLFLLMIALVDLTTQTGLHMRWVLDQFGHKAISRPEITEPGAVGLRRMAPYGTGDMADHILKLRPHFEMMENELLPWNLWQYKLFNSARNSGADLKQEIESVKTVLTRDPDHNTLPIGPEGSGQPEFAPFLGRPVGTGVKGAVRIDKFTYNDLHLTVDSSEPAILFIRDAYYPGWSATVNNQSVPIARALLNFKGVAVPKGRSELKLRFRPGVLGWALAAAYTAFALLLACCWRSAFGAVRKGVTARERFFLLLGISTTNR